MRSLLTRSGGPFPFLWIALAVLLSCGAQGVLGRTQDEEPEPEHGSVQESERFDVAGLRPATPTGPLDVLEGSRARLVTQATVWAHEAPRFVLEPGEKELLASSLAERASRRTFEGAPPVMPHSSDFSGGRQSCLDCHARGMSIGTRVARAMSHPALPNCEQCHLESRHTEFPATRKVRNRFRGVLPGDGNRATARGVYEGTPPAIPHALQMRQNCLSCHGEFGWLGLRIDHAGRANCMQCHVPGTVFEEGS